MESLLCAVLLIASASHCQGMGSDMNQGMGQGSSDNASFTLTLSSVERDCSRGDNGVTDSSIQVQYRFFTGDNANDWIGLDSKQGFNGTMVFSLPRASQQQQYVQFRLLQLEHGGGSCNCWRVERAVFMQGNDNTALTDEKICSIMLNESDSLTFCNGLAREARGLIFGEVRIKNGEGNQFSCRADSSIFINASGSDFRMQQDCFLDTYILKLEVSYGLTFEASTCSGSCDGPEDISEAVEFAMRTNTSGVYGPWIPLRLTQHTGSHTTPVNVRGYEVEAHQVASEMVTEHVTICGNELLPDNTSEVQFRWMNTVDGEGIDFWTIFNVTIDLINGDDSGRVFDSRSQSSQWQQVRNGGINCTSCPGVGLCDLAFGNDQLTNTSLVSNIALTERLSLRNSSFLVESQLNPAPTVTALCTSSESRKISPSTTTYVSVSAMTSQQLSSNYPLSSSSATSTSGLHTSATIQPSPSTTSPTTTGNSIVDTVLSADSLKGIQLLRNNSEELKPADTLYLLKDILDRFNSTDREEKKELAENFLEIGEKLIIAGKEQENMDTMEDTVGSSLLAVMDRLALEVFPSVGNISTQNIALQTLVVSVDNESIATINSNDYFDDLPLMSIEIPSELVEVFQEESTISALYYNVKDLFPDGPLLGSGVVSTGLQCGDSLCNTTEIKLTKPVVITIEHKTKLKTTATQKTETKCVFWDFSEENWSDRGCSRNATLSNDSYTVCECDHLTHFAILLSPVSLDAFSPEVQISLQVIGYVGVTISLVAMAVTIMTFILFKSLHTMRNYIHINLCINLMIAQLIFVVGINKSAEDHVPVHCQAIAVLLHYFFLVSFMWMLMEGVVLYVVLVLVFAKHKKFYILGFTIASYGIPLLYMGLTLPLGFALNGEHYGRRSACFLNPETHFIWAFIAPVIVIIVMNFVLFLIVAKVMWKHQKRMTDKAKLVNVRRWLRSAMFLVVIMGLTWIIGVLVLEVEALLPLAYIFTIMVAFQGLAIFLIFVPFSKQVRDTFRKWWKVKVNDSTILTRYFGSDTLSYGSNLKSSQKNSTLPSRNDEKKDASFLMDSIAKDVSFEKNGKHFEDSSIVISNRFSTSIDLAYSPK